MKGGFFSIFLPILASLCICMPVFANPSDSLPATEDVIHAEAPMTVTADSEDSDVAPYVTITGEGGIAKLTYTGGGVLYWSIDPYLSSSYFYNLTIILTNNRTGAITTYPFSGFGTGCTERVIDLDVSDGNTYTATMSGHADDVLLGLYYYFGDGLTVRFTVRF